MKELFSLRHWALMMIVLPTVIVGLLIGGYLTYKRFDELDQNLIERGIFLAEPLALVSAQAIKDNQRESLIDALDMAHRKASPIVRSITVFLPDHEIYHSSNTHHELDKIRLKPGVLIPDSTNYEVKDKYIYVRSPIIGKESSEESFIFIKKNGKTLYGYLVVELSRDQAVLDQQSALFAIIAILVASIIFTSLFAVTFIRNLVVPIETLNNAAKDIASGKGKMKILTPMLGELDSLRDGVNQLAKEVYNANERAEHNISEYTQELQQTVEQLEIQNIQLNMAKKEAQDANKVKSQFLANMSHELRTPLNGVLGFTRQLKKTSLNINQRDFLETIEASAQNLLRIINDILDFSKLDAGKMELEKMPFSLRDNLNEVMTLLAPNVFDKGLDIYCNIDSHIPDDLSGDPDRLKQIVINLMGNAIKFTSQGHVRLDVKFLGSSERGQHLKFEVSDTGLGIDEEGQKKLFAAFGQADSSITRKFGGTGLGLIICKKLIEAMNGHIHFTSEKGKGSQFYFDVLIEESNVKASNALPVEYLAGKKILFLDTCGQSISDVATMLNEETELQLTVCDSEQDFALELDTNRFDMVLISKRVSPSKVGELKQLIQIAKQRCSHVYTMINSISPNMKEAFIGSGATGCLSQPANHRKLFNLLAKPYLNAYQDVQTNVVNFNGLKVLAVDDNAANLKLLTTLLSEMAVTSETACDGQVALEMSQKHKYDMIFMDIQMPIMDGMTSCKMIKDASLNEDTPIISVTAHAAPEEQKKMAEFGFDGYLAKPIDEEMLKQIMLESGLSEVSSTREAELVLKQQNVQMEFPETPAFAEHPHVDWTIALQRAAGKTDLAIEMLVMLINSLPEAAEKMNEFYQQDDLEQLIAIVHKFHGACCYTGVPKLKQLAETIESELKAKSDIRQVEPELLELMDELQALQSDAKSWGLVN